MTKFAMPNRSNETADTIPYEISVSRYGTHTTHKMFDNIEKARIYFKRQAKDGFHIECAHIYKAHVLGKFYFICSIELKNDDYSPVTPGYQKTSIYGSRAYFIRTRGGFLNNEHKWAEIPIKTPKIEPKPVEIEEIPEFVPFENFYRKNEPYEDLVGDEMIAVLNDMNFSVSSNGHTEYYDSYETALESTKTLDLFGIDWVLYELDSYSKYGDVISIPIADSVNGEY